MLTFVFVLWLAQAESVERTGHSSADDASAAASGQYGAVVPTRIETEWFQAPRTTWIAINPRWNNGKSVVPAVDSPPPQIDYSSCRAFGVTPHYSAQNYASWQAREDAWSALAPLVREHTAKLALPVGEATAYVLVIPTVYATDCVGPR